MTVIVRPPCFLLICRIGGSFPIGGNRKGTEVLGYIRDNIFLIIAFAIGFGIAVFSVFKPWKGGLWNYPSDPVEQRRLGVSVIASFVGMLFMMLHIYTRR